jgi:hypothetical protein
MIDRLLAWLDQPRSAPRSRYEPHDFRPPAANGGHGLDTRSWARGLDR